MKDVQHFNSQLTPTTLKNVELLKYFKISKIAPTCFGLQGNHHQGATISTLLKITHLVKSRYTASAYLLLTKCLIFSKVLTVAP